MLGCVQVRNLVKPITSLKKLQVSLTLAPGLPPIVVGDDKRLMQTALNVVGNAVKFTKEGSISIKVCLERPEHTVDPLVPEFHPMQGEQHCYIRVEVLSLWFIFLWWAFCCHLCVSLLQSRIFKHPPCCLFTDCYILRRYQIQGCHC